MYRCPNQKCLRHLEPIKVVEIDEKTHKKWLITTCPKCGHKSEIEEFKRKGKND